MNRFTQRFAPSIVFTLGCFDRVIFRGYLPFGKDAFLNRFVDHGLKIRRKDFLPFVETQSETLVAQAKDLAQLADAPYHYLQGQHNKEQFIRDLARCLFPKPTTDPTESKRRTAHVSRRFQLLRARGLLAKIPHAHRYRITAKGEDLMSAALYVRYKTFPKELDHVA